MLSPWDLEACKGLGLCGPVWGISHQGDLYGGMKVWPKLGGAGDSSPWKSHLDCEELVLACWRLCRPQRSPSRQQAHLLAAGLRSTSLLLPPHLEPATKLQTLMSLKLGLMEASRNGGGALNCALNA